MKYSIVQINRNTETKCKCGSTCEKISFEVADELGNVETYGSSCIKSVLGIDTKGFELKRGHQTLKLKVIKSFEESQSFQALHKELRVVNNVNPDNIVYKVVAKWVVVDLFTTLKELSGDKSTINYNYKASKASHKQACAVQTLEVGARISDIELRDLMRV